MKWSEVRKTYPNKFIVFESLNQYEENSVLFVTDLAIVEVFDELGKAFKYYSKLHKEDKNRTLNIGDTKKEELIYNVKCMISGCSIRKSAKIVGISIPTSFYWRHKILDALRIYLGVGFVSGVVEADETMFRISYKGNHSKNPNFTMPRKSFKRGPKSLPSPNEPKRQRGVSNQRVSVMCALDRSGNIISELLCNGRMKYIDADRLFKNRIEDKSTLCVDSHKSYIKLSDNFDVDLQQIESGKYKKGIYHIQHINAYHSRLKGWMKKFNGVSTKHLCGYMYWFKWLELFKEDRDEVKYHKLFVQSHSVYSTTKLKDFKVKQPIYI